MIKNWTCKYKCLALLIVLIGGLTSCSPGNPPIDRDQKSSDGAYKLSGAGSTFATNLYHEYFDTLYQEKGIQVKYQEIGSTGGIIQLIEKNVNFAGTEAPMKMDQIQKAGSTMLHIPTGIGAVAIAYHLEDIHLLNLDAPILANIFLGNIRRWSDVSIKALNPTINLPDEDILVIHRFDRSGTAYAFSDYLSKTNAEWERKMGTSTSLDWPIGINAEGNIGVAQTIKNTANSIGFLSLDIALKNQLKIASIRNKRGNFITPSIESIQYTTETTIPENTTASLTNADDPQAYPIATLNWMVVYREQDDGLRSIGDARTLARMLEWMVTEGQSINEKYYFAPLTEDLADKAKKLIHSITYDENPVLN